jgi:hypothetical protein
MIGGMKVAQEAPAALGRCYKLAVAAKASIDFEIPTSA